MSLESYLPKIFQALRAKGILKGADAPQDPTIELSLVPNEELRTLKKEFLNKNVEIVDVLAFPAPEAKDFPNPQAGSVGRYLGEVYINEDIARDDHARAVFLLVHGVLHLLGYRHEEKHDIIVMERLEQELMKTLV
jgi:probable rRNA maturation factor